MGTRGLTAVFVDGTYKIANYGQWDHYPSNQGAKALSFLRSLDSERRAAFAEKCRAVRALTPAEIDGLGAGWRETHPQLSRDHGAEILRVVNDAPPGLPLVVNIDDLASDSLMIEWGYVVDLDKGTFEVYRGFNTAPVPDGERFAHYNVTRPPERSYSGTSYYALRHVVTFALDALPDEDAFVRAAEPAEDEDAA